MRGRRRLAWLAFFAVLLAAAPPGAPGQVMDRATYLFVQMDELEYVDASDRPIGFAGMAWFGGDYSRVWLRAEGDHATRAGGERELEAQLLYSRLVAPFWEAQAGLRVDRRYGRESATRALFVLGLEGLAPYWFEVTPALFLSQEGDLSARLEGSWELLFTQRLVLEPEGAVDLALQEVPEFGVGSGLNRLELGARLRYEIVRELAPYVGWSWSRRFGGSADLAREEGEGVGGGALVAGLRFWY